VSGLLAEVGLYSAKTKAAPLGSSKRETQESSEDPTSLVDIKYFTVQFSSVCRPSSVKPGLDQCVGTLIL
ncbi:UNVERIFIED_CONTAM: hypothetical protein K2H54_062081, partial [Gekko kuhli]